MLFFSRVNIGLENNEHLTANLQTLTAWRPTQSPDDMAAVLLTALSEPPSWLSSSFGVLLNLRTVIGCDWSAGLWVQILMWTPPQTRMSLFLGRTLTPRLKDTSKTSEWSQERSHWELSSLHLSFKSYVLQPWTLTFSMAAVTGEPDLGSSRTEERKSSSCRLNWQLFPPLRPAVDDIISQTLHTHARTHTNAAQRGVWGFHAAT